MISRGAHYQDTLIWNKIRELEARIKKLEQPICDAIGKETTIKNIKCKCGETKAKKFTDMGKKKGIRQPASTKASVSTGEASVLSSELRKSKTLTQNPHQRVREQFLKPLEPEPNPRESNNLTELESKIETS